MASSGFVVELCPGVVCRASACRCSLEATGGIYRSPLCDSYRTNCGCLYATRSARCNSVSSSCLLFQLAAPFRTTSNVTPATLAPLLCRFTEAEVNEKVEEEKARLTAEMEASNALEKREK